MARAVDVIESGRLADGPEVRAFEDAFAEFCDAEHGVATANGTTALHAALRGLGVSAGDRVVTTPFSFVATANAIRLCGAEPVFVDVDPETMNLDPAAVREAIEDCDGDVDAILAVHLYGLPAPMDELDAIAEEYDVALVEDAAQAHGATLDGRPVGAIGDAGCFSFYPTKNATCGEGGIVVTDDETLSDDVAQFVNHGRSDQYEHVRVGHNFRLTSVGAAIGGAQLRKLPRFNAARRRAAKRYTEALADTPSVEAPREPPGSRHVYHQYTVRTEHRDDLQAYLEDEDVDTAVYYPTPIHQQPAYDRDESYPVAETLAEQVLSIPVHPDLEEQDIDHIATLLAEYES